jgi:HAD superfamily hydrolase (TIGR01549 family)
MSSFFASMPKKVVFFDMNNTLVDRRQCFDSAFLEVMNDVTARWDPDDDFAWTAQDALQSYKMEWSKHRKMSTQTAISPEELRQICLRKAVAPLPISVQPAFAKAFFEQIENKEEGHVTLFPDVEETLQSLAERYTLAIISNGDRSRLEANVQKLRLSEWIPADRIFSSQLDGPRKPHPAIFETAMRKIGTTPVESIMVGNSWKSDIIGATRCGLDAVWINPAQIKKVSHRKLGKQKVIIIRVFKQLQNIL